MHPCIIFLGSCSVYLFVSFRALGHLHDKLEFIENGVHVCIFYDVFDVGVYAGSSPIEVSHLYIIGTSLLPLLSITEQSLYHRKVLSPCAYWSQARMINDLLSTTFNWYLLLHSNAISVTSIFSCIHFLHSTLCRLHHGMNFLISSCATCFLSQSIPTMISCC